MELLPLVLHVLNVIVIWAVLSLSLNFLQGTAGLFNLGHAAFFCVGAYASALLAKAGLPWIVCLLASVLFPALLALVYGLPTLRLKADYFATVTMGIGEIIRAVANNLQGVTGGPNGVPSIPCPSLFGFQFSRGPGTLVLGCVVLLLTYLALDRWRRSGFGRVLIAAREDPTAAQAMGKDTYHFRLNCFLLSAGFAGIAGSLFAYYYGYISPGDFGLWVAYNLTLTLTIGGSGNYRGTMLAAAVFIIMRDGLRFLPLPPTAQGPLQQLLFGLLMIVIMWRFPQGLIPEVPTITFAKHSSQRSEESWESQA